MKRRLLSRSFVHPVLIALVALAAFARAPCASAHGMRTAFLDVEAYSFTDAVVRFRAPPGATQLKPYLAACSLEPASDIEAVHLTDAGTLSTLHAHCPQGVEGATIGIGELGGGADDAVVLFTHGTGQEGVSHVLSVLDPSWTLPRAEGFVATALTYVKLGATHILGGYDHLLFLGLLVLLLQKPRSILLAETAFALSHGVTFSLTALGIVRVPPAPAEACIAVSLVLLAAECSHPSRLRASRRPWRGAAMALVFGAVHGFGFAGALREAGLPEKQVTAALAGFGMGVELGQVGFVLTLLLLLASARRVARPVTGARAAAIAVFASGVLAAWWTAERTISCFSNS